MNILSLKPVFIISMLLVASIAQARSNEFDIKRLPKGKSVTLPHTAVTFVPVTDKVKLASTDMPQMVKLSAISKRKGKTQDIRVAIFDSQSDRVKYVLLKPGASYLYNFKDLGSISVVPEIAKLSVNDASAHYQLKVESNKPLEVSR